MGERVVVIEEPDRQVILLALAELALSRPGWDHYLGGVAEKLSGRGMWERFKDTSSDVVARAAVGEARCDACGRLKASPDGG